MARTRTHAPTCRGCGTTFIGIAHRDRYTSHSWRCRRELERLGLIELIDELDPTEAAQLAEEA